MDDSRRLLLQWRLEMLVCNADTYQVPILQMVYDFIIQTW